MLDLDRRQVLGTAATLGAAASLATVEGSWTVTGLQDEDYALVVTAGGNFTATPTDGNPGTSPDPGCPFSGTLTPRPSGKNVFNVTFLTGASAVDCTYPNEASSGVAIAYPVAGGTQLILAVTKNTDRQRGAVVAGLKP